MTARRLGVVLVVAGVLLLAGSALVPGGLERAWTAAAVGLLGAPLLVAAAKALGALVQRPDR